MEDEYVAKDDRKVTKMKVKKQNFMVAKAKAYILEKKQMQRDAQLDVPKRKDSTLSNEFSNVKKGWKPKNTARTDEHGSVGILIR